MPHTVCSRFFSLKMWPSFEEYKASMEKWLNSNHVNYLKEIEDWKWINAFIRKHHSVINTLVIKYFKWLILILL